jgi:large subunit ribosomal protein L6
MSSGFVYEKRIEIPSDCQVTLERKTFTVSGPKGTLSRSFPEPYTTVAMEGNEIVASTNISRKKTKALVGTVIAHLRNMFVGVQHGYTYEMKIVFSHFPMTVEVQGQEVLIKNFIGERGVRRARLIGDVQVKVTEDDVIIDGIDIEHVSQSAANIQLATKIRDKDRRVFLDGIYVIRKRKGETVKSIV